MASLYFGGDYQEPHFLESCSLCRRALGFNSDIFMYRGDTPFCSKECREEQIEMDEAQEKRLKKMSRSIRKPSSSSDATSNSKETETNVRPGTLVTA